MFRITVQNKRDLSVVTLDGCLAASDVEELHRLFSSVKMPVRLILSDLEICSSAAVVELRHWIDKGFAIQRATPYIRMLLTKETEQTTTINKK